MKKSLFVFVSMFFGIASQLSFAAGCGSGSSTPDIIGGCPVTETNGWPECDRSIPVNKVEGYFYYWDEFFADRDVACQTEFLRLPASIEVMKDLQLCLNLPCTNTDGQSCHHDIVVQPYFYDTQTAAKGIARQESCGRRRFEAKGCFVKGTKGRVFVANYIGYALKPVRP
ncbi:MAG: hypothetical protein NT027_14115 [Proteobacteria bacterium]|nr:hypothetical protein [Pseudomonadota bacterium]